MPGCLGCQKCESGPVVTLRDGRVVCNECEDYRAECEARYVVAMAGREQRREYLAVVRKRRGDAAADALAAAVRDLWNDRAR